MLLTTREQQDVQHLVWRGDSLAKRAKGAYPFDPRAPTRTRAPAVHGGKGWRRHAVCRYPNEPNRPDRGAGFAAPEQSGRAMRKDTYAKGATHTSRPLGNPHLGRFEGRGATELGNGEISTGLAAPQGEPAECFASLAACRWPMSGPCGGVADVPAGSC